MKKLLFASVLLAIQVFATPLSTERSAWTSRWGVQWKYSPDGIAANQYSGVTEYASAPYSRTCSIEAVVTPLERYGNNWSICGLRLMFDNKNFWQLNFTDVPDKMRDKLKPLYEMHESNGGKWPWIKNYQEITIENNEQWQYNETYHMSLSLVDDVVTGVIKKLDGTVCYRKVVKLVTNEANRIVRPAIIAGSLKSRFTQLKADWGEPVEIETAKHIKTAEEYPAYECASYVKDIQDKATGFFRVMQRDDGKWWVIDPLGRGFVVFGVDHCTYDGHWCEALQKHLHREFNEKKFASREEWGRVASNYLKEWGFNLLSAGNSPEARYKGIPHTIFLGIGSTAANQGPDMSIMENGNIPGSAFPNPFHPEFRDFCAYILKERCTAHVNDPWIFGYFIDNELCWWGRAKAESGLFNWAMKLPRDHTAKIALKNLLQDKAQNDLAVCNRQWNLQLKSFDELLDITELPEINDEQLQLKRDFLALCADTYFRIIAEEFRKIDPNHLLLGSRFAGLGHDEVIWRAAGKYNDIVTVNHYGYVEMNSECAYTTGHRNAKPLIEALADAYSYCQRPMMMTEWSFPALDSGLPCTHGAGQRFRTQKERAKATSIFARTMLASPYMVGYDYFMWVDEPYLGISGKFPENSNYGLISEKFEIYEDIVNTFKSIQLNPTAARRLPPPPVKHIQIIEKGDLYKKYLAPLPKMAGSKPHPAFTVSAKDQRHFSVGNGRLKLVADGKSANLQVYLDGEYYGLFNVMLFYHNEKGANTWTNATAIDTCDIKADGEKLVLTLCVSKPVITQDKLDDAKSLVPFVMDYRLVLLPEADWFLSEIVSVTNPDDKADLSVEGLYMRLYADYSVKDIERLQVPNLWDGDATTAWQEEGGRNRYMGVTSLKYQGNDLRYWLTGEGKDRVQHADALRRDRCVIPPHGTHRSTTAFYLMNYFGKGDSTTIVNHQSRLRELDYRQ